MKDLVAIFGILLLSAAALGAGWFLGGAGAAAPAPEAAEEDHGHSHGGGGGGATGPVDRVTISERMRRSIGIETTQAVLRRFTRHVELPATVVSDPQALRPIVAPLGGIVTHVHVTTGQPVREDSTLVRITRDPIALPEASRTEDLLPLRSEPVHESVSALRTALGRLEIANRELTRIERIEADNPEGLPVVPRRERIQLQYEVARSKTEVANARHELELHGLTDEEISAIEKGQSPPPSSRLWVRALRKAEVWDASSDALLTIVTSKQAGPPWVTALIGELSVRGLLTSEALEAFRTSEALRVHFRDAAALLLQGMPVAALTHLADQGALAASFEVRLEGGAGFEADVHALHVVPGTRVARGDMLVSVFDARRMWLRVEPLGSEVGRLVEALTNRSAMHARPLIEGTGPQLDDVRLSRMETHTDDTEREHAYAPLANAVVATSDDPPGRTWRLRTGMQYLLAVPERRVDGVFVLPTDAVIRRGNERVILIADGDEFRAVPVTIVDEDGESVAIANDGAIFPNDPVLVRGAFEVGLAMQRDEGSGDAGHGHSHG